MGGVLARGLAITALAGCGLCGSSSGDSSGSRPLPAPHGARPISVRLFQGGADVLPHETARSAAHVIANLRPTFVTAPLRFAARDSVSRREVRAWSVVRKAVLADRPDAQFTVMLNADHYPTAKRMRQRMTSLRRLLRPDGWAFDFWTRLGRAHAGAAAAAIRDAHTHGELIGGDIFGLTSNPVIPRGTDFVIVQGAGFVVDLPAVRRLSRRFAVFLQLGNSPKYARSDGCQFIKHFSGSNRRGYIAQRAAEQERYRYRFMYPVFFPLCKKRVTPEHRRLIAYDAARDGSTLDRIEHLLERYAPTRRSGAR